ncbi:MAG: Rieske 2Fe-2S domain-containing protein [Chloroflexota bacterium]|nr:Rieske 2Fe-2S domain-containing protein [Chloroflexota bacterium]
MADDTTTTEATSTEAAPGFIDRLSDSLQNIIKAIIGSNRKPPRRFKSLLHGTWLGHPLHPALTDVPIGAWMMAVIFDLIWLFAPGAPEWAVRGAQVAGGVGILGALAAAVTGLADWSDSYGPERTTGLYHAALNTLALILFIVSGALRLGTATGVSDIGVALDILGLISVLIAAYLGGHMAFALGTGVNHSGWGESGESYEAALPVAEMPANGLKRVVVAGAPVVMLRMGDRYYAIGATCSHAGGPLDEGELQGDVVQCPWHGSRFNMRTGKPVTGPASIAQPRYDVRVRDGMIELRRA